MHKRQHRREYGKCMAPDYLRKKADEMLPHSGNWQKKKRLDFPPCSWNLLVLEKLKKK